MRIKALHRHPEEAVTILVKCDVLSAVDAALVQFVHTPGHVPGSGDTSVLGDSPRGTRGKVTYRI